MNRKSFLAPEARRQAVEIVGEIEATTSAEIVVTVRESSASQLAPDLIAGSVVAFVVLLCLLFLPQSFEIKTMPLDVALGFGLGVLVSSRWPGLRRVLTSPTQRENSVLTAARATFVELGVSRTRGRNGVLVYVSLIERAVSVVTDVGIDTKALGPAWVDAMTALEAAVDRCDFEAFKAAMRQLAPPLAAAMPRSADDIDELANNLGDP